MRGAPQLALRSVNLRASRPSRNICKVHFAHHRAMVFIFFKLNSWISRFMSCVWKHVTYQWHTGLRHTQSRRTAMQFWDSECLFFSNKVTTHRTHRTHTLAVFYRHTLQSRYFVKVNCLRQSGGGAQTSDCSRSLRVTVITGHGHVYGIFILATHPSPSRSRSSCGLPPENFFFRFLVVY
jgi:hypothetical protein